jgi:hypothetical protein
MTEKEFDREIVPIIESLHGSLEDEELAINLLFEILVQER